MSTPMTEELFTIFHKSPPEIQLEIMKQCFENDLVCFSLTCRDMHYLAKPLLPNKPDLSNINQLGSTPDVPPICFYADHPCRRGEEGCKGARGRIVKYNFQWHRKKRHYYKKRYPACNMCLYYPPDHPVCQISGCKKHFALQEVYYPEKE
ncbi:unnamed protein product [Fusarium venenatum]|uniref:F-box domain-containing protein n=1 Tax=Fusarium venenatum TaxID=56646 RepID=A0A2L2TZ42_9HYPO|nr:uncharacterized protein FVRRES_10443 [Fusarium venenatum]CEI70366.1 unnamed protein product [Fusarium venenatum]